MTDIDPLWIAPRTGHDWRDDTLLQACKWFRSFVPAIEMERRMDACREFYLNARTRWQAGEECQAFDPKDSVAWFLFQAETYAIDRECWLPDEAARIVPYLCRIAEELQILKSIDGAEVRAERIMLGGRSQPGSGIFELLVALAYRRCGWTNVSFTPEQPGKSRTPDLQVTRPGTRWAVECKRLQHSSYAKREAEIGKNLAQEVHKLCERVGKSLIIEVRYHKSLEDLPNDYLVSRIEDLIKRRLPIEETDDVADVRLRDIQWDIAHTVLARDDVYFNSSRMIELLSGYYHHGADHSLSTRWRPAPDRPTYAEAVYRASLVSWINVSQHSLKAKARHFKQTLAKAERQLPYNMPGVVHIGIESFGIDRVDYVRHALNSLSARDFVNHTSRMRWVYGNYFLHEVTTRQHESWAFVETMVPYRTGQHRTSEPLPGHLLVSPEDCATEGVHWD